MALLILRAVFVVMTAAVAALYASRTFDTSLAGFTFTIVGAIFLAGLIVVLDVTSPRKRLSAISGLFLGLIVGMIGAYALSFLVEYAASTAAVAIWEKQVPAELVEGLKVVMGVICVFLATTMILQSKDDFRFVIPYVEFAKQIRGNRPMLLDTSAIIDGRILDIVQTQIVQGLIVIPKFVLDELHTISDSRDKLKRERGRRGLDIVAKLQAEPMADVSIEDTVAEGATVDQKLTALAQDMRARLITTDYNLKKVASLRGVDVININELANAMRPVVLPGEHMRVRIVKPGEAPAQGVGYLEDGTMVVVEQARNAIGEEVDLTVTSVLQTSVGRMIFGRLGHDGGEHDEHERREPRSANAEAHGEPRQASSAGRNPRRSKR